MSLCCGRFVVGTERANENVVERNEALEGGIDIDFLIIKKMGVLFGA